MRESLVAKKNIKKGEKLNDKNLTIKGPGGGLLPKYLEMLKNRSANKTIKKDTPITWEDI